MEHNQYLDDIKHIRSIMERSSSFVSLSGLSGISAGVVALMACFVAFGILHHSNIDYVAGKSIEYGTDVITQLILLSVATLVLSVILAIFFTVQKSRRINRPIWNHVTKQTLIALAIPLVTGGIFSLILVLHHSTYFVAPTMLVFYGLALVSAARYMPSELVGLGLLEIVLGLVSLYWVGYGLIFWGIGFGILHIVYGWYMHKKYK